MIQAFFNLSKPPFRSDLPPDKIFKSATFKEGLERLNYLKTTPGIMILTGRPGCGKSSLARIFTYQLSSQHFKPFYFALSTVTPMDFYRQLNFSLTGQRLSRKTDLFRSIQTALQTMVQIQKIVPVVIFDECHLLKNENFLELQLLLNFNYDSVMPAIVVMLGQPDLRARLSFSIFESFTRRITMKYAMDELTPIETKAFITHSILLAGGPETLFSEDAIEAIHIATQGLPGLIGKLAVKALTAAYMKKQMTVTAENICQASEEM